MIALSLLIILQVRSISAMIMVFMISPLGLGSSPAEVIRETGSTKGSPMSSLCC